MLHKSDLVSISFKQWVNSYKLLYTVFLQSFDDLVAKNIPKRNMKIKDKDGSDMGESVGPDYIVCIEYKYVGSSYTHQITWY